MQRAPDHANITRKDHPRFEEIEQRHERKEHTIMLTLQGKITVGLRKKTKVGMKAKITQDERENITQDSGEISP